jgi:hypothetical protein
LRRPKHSIIEVVQPEEEEVHTCREIAKVNTKTNTGQMFMIAGPVPVIRNF